MSKSTTTLTGQPTTIISNDEDVFGVLDRLKANISEIKSANSSRNSIGGGSRTGTMERRSAGTTAAESPGTMSVAVTEPGAHARGRHSRQSSITGTATIGGVADYDQQQPHSRHHKSNRLSSHGTEGPSTDSKTVRNGGDISESGGTGTGKRNGNRSRQESYSSRADDSSRISTRSHVHGMTFFFYRKKSCYM